MLGILGVPTVFMHAWADFRSQMVSCCWKHVFVLEQPDWKGMKMLAQSYAAMDLPRIVSWMGCKLHYHVWNTQFVLNLQSDTCRHPADTGFCQILLALSTAENSFIESQVEEYEFRIKHFQFSTSSYLSLVCSEVFSSFSLLKQRQSSSHLTFLRTG